MGGNQQSWRSLIQVGVTVEIKGVPQDWDKIKSRKSKRQSDIKFGGQKKGHAHLHGRIFGCDASLILCKCFTWLTLQQFK